MGLGARTGGRARPASWGVTGPRSTPQHAAAAAPLAATGTGGRRGRPCHLSATRRRRNNRRGGRAPRVEPALDPRAPSGNDDDFRQRQCSISWRIRWCALAAAPSAAWKPHPGTAQARRRTTGADLLRLAAAARRGAQAGRRRRASSAQITSSGCTAATVPMLAAQRCARAPATARPADRHAHLRRLRVAHAAIRVLDIRLLRADTEVR